MTGRRAGFRGDGRALFDRPGPLSGARRWAGVRRDRQGEGWPVWPVVEFWLTAATGSTTMLSMVVDDGSAVAQLRRGVAGFCVLACLQRGETYGFELARTLREAGLVAGEGTVYPLLTRLRGLGWVETVWRPSSEGPPRRYLRLTPLGSEALRQFEQQWGSFRDTVDAFLGLRAGSEDIGKGGIGDVAGDVG
jgi:PadR family transcriptional regulator PadR